MFLYYFFPLYSLALPRKNIILILTSEGLPITPMPGNRKGYVDRFGNIWVQGRSVTKGQSFEWDVQLSKQGIQQVGWMTKDNSHLNVSLDGRVTHK